LAGPALSAGILGLPGGRFAFVKMASAERFGGGSS